MGFTHAISGTAAWLAVTSALPALGVDELALTPAAVLAGALVAGGAALLPDADHKSATIANTIPVVGKLVTDAIGDLGGGHRNGAHSLLAAALVTAGAVGIDLWRVDLPMLGETPIGPAIATAALIAFAARARELVAHWSTAWLLGLASAAIVFFFAADSTVWFPLAVGLGFVAHLVGDALTDGGIPGALWPIRIRPPASWSRTPVLRRLWKRNGHIAFPILGNAGSFREKLVAIALGIYCVYAAATPLFEWADLPMLTALPF
ncbi:metal-dependent hydrolase [Herbiconiux sp. L3-i23]|uniref:metal-dependent hydrolase n=1 Tax=Herbiconiux sp. L3-i23 TaxID=2905871 RepID=UPI00206F4840|nr:metal-dependent hydrolase [Herbiconiux sp. L3-i23]BDI21878.1 metal-dependent hydrolase [Herbiconiux sp. L3-i23]